MAKPYLEHLLAFSDNIFADGRSQLIQRLSDEELLTLIRDGLGRTSRKAREMLSVNLLDLINTEPRTSELLVGNNFRQPTQSAPAPTPTPNAHGLATSGMASQRGQPKRKATENADPFGIRSHPAAALNATNEGISNSFSGDQEDDEDWEGMTAEHDHDLQDETPADSRTSINVVNIWSTAFVIPKLKIGAWVRNTVGCEGWQPLGDLVSSTGNSIHARFLADFAFRVAYGAVAMEAARYIGGGKCVNIAVWQKGCGQSTFEKAHGNKQRACDTCIRTKRLCVRVVPDGSGAKLCVFPLPEECRGSKALDSIAGWVIGG
ncbi:hypothetical protein J4E93_001022 [Alternaria ventricosa]|uniref:uncharacterized protein n=1 Tax=Alternaria ventricosa TaxID=1187951 RepID=UPI0020C33324|nr:uncharacterized protein J4E93_001022 [Alternaria ventricosa]KAI4656303.1 hypothetical protein J4E93_001022 [Alternaria ventricosa]